MSQAAKLPVARADRRTGVIYLYWSEGRRSKRVSTRTRDPVEAAAFLAEWVKGHKTEAVAPAGLTIAEAWTAYRTGHVERKTVSPSARIAIWNRLEPHFADKRLDELTQDDIDDYWSKRSDLAESTRYFDLAMLVTIERFCVKKSLLPAFMRRWELPDADIEPRDRWLREGEIESLYLAAASERGPSGRLTDAELFLWIGLNTGARKTAILQLEWATQIDLTSRHTLEDGSVHVGIIDFRKPGRRQTRKRRAVVPVNRLLMPVLQRAYAERMSAHVFRPGFRPYHAMQRLGRIAGVEGVTPHVLRHTMATHMARRGVSLFHVAKVLGDTLATVERVYAKHAPEHLVGAVNAMAGVGNGMSTNMGAVPKMGVKSVP